MTGAFGVKIDSELCCDYTDTTLRDEYETDEPDDCVMDCANGLIKFSKFAFRKSKFFRDEYNKKAVIGTVTKFDCKEFRKEAIKLYADVLHDKPLKDFTTFEIFELIIFLLRDGKADKYAFEGKLLKDCMLTLVSTTMPLGDAVVLSILLVKNGLKTVDTKMFEGVAAIEFQGYAFQLMSEMNNKEPSPKWAYMIQWLKGSSFDAILNGVKKLVSQMKLKESFGVTQSSDGSSQLNFSVNPFSTTDSDPRPESEMS